MSVKDKQFDMIPLILRRHRCPHQPSNDILNKTLPPCTITEYAMQYKKYNSKPRASLKPPQKPMTSDVKMNCQTTNRHDFIAHQISVPSQKPAAVYKVPEGKMEMQTEYKNEFLGKWAVPATLIRPSPRKKDDTGPFAHKSTQAVDFVPFPPAQRELHKMKSAYEPPTEVFEGKSTVKSDFTDFGRVEVTQSLKPPQTAKISTDPFDGTSYYRMCFTPQPMPERFQRPKVVYYPPQEAFCGSTTFNCDFPAHSGAQPSDSMKPVQKSITSDSPFDGTTISRLSYRVWELPTRHSRPPTVYAPPTEKFSTRSTFKEDFPDYGRVEPARRLKPPARVREQVTSFDGLTTQSCDFKAWKEVERPYLNKREKRYEPPTEKFSAISTFQAHYKGECGSRAQTAKPSVKIYSSKGEMDSTTSYRESYSQSGYRPCPAMGLLGNIQTANNYKFAHQDETTGHKYFLPLKKAAGDPSTDSATLVA